MVRQLVREFRAQIDLLSLSYGRILGPVRVGRAPECAGLIVDRGERLTVHAHVPTWHAFGSDFLARLTPMFLDISKSSSILDEERYANTTLDWYVQLMLH